MLNCKKTMIDKEKKNCYKYCILWLCVVQFWLWKLRIRFSEVLICRFCIDEKRLQMKNIFLCGNRSLIKNHSLLDNPHLPIQDLNTNFHLEPKNRKLKIWDRRKCDVGASKNAKQAFSTPRLSSHFLLSQISSFRFFSPSNSYLFSRYHDLYCLWNDTDIYREAFR